MKNENQKKFFFVKAQKGPYGNTEIKPLKCKFFTAGKKAITPPRRSRSPLLFFLVGYAILKDLFILVWREIHRRKFYRWRHDNWPIGQWVIFHAAPDKAYVNHFFPAWIYNMTQIHSGETSWPRDCVARSVAARLHALKLASITFQELMLGRLVASLPVEVLNKVFYGEGPPQVQTSYYFWHKRYPFPILCIDKRDAFTYHVKCLC